MGALIAVVNKKGDNAFNTAITMLETLGHRGFDAFGIASSHKVSARKSLRELEGDGVNSNALLGYNLAKVLPRDRIQPVQKSDVTLVFEGRIFPVPSQGEVKFALQRLGSVEDKAIHLIRKFKGDYVFAIQEDGKMVVGRDPVGVRPLYFGESQDFCAVASERKALWKIGISKTCSFPPGRVAIINKKGAIFKTVRTITQPPLQKLEMKTAAKKLENALFGSTKERTSDVEKIAIAFSGGLDSSILAFLTKLCNVDARLIHVSLEGHDEIDFAERAAMAMDLPFHCVVYSVDDLEETLNRVLWLIEESNPVNASIAIPMFWVAEQSAKLGIRVLMVGQGSDELFGGYQRYLDDYEKHGLVGVQEKLFQDVVSSHESNFQRDNKVCAYNGVELRAPFADWNLIQLALSLSADLKITSTKDVLRKRVLRQMARNLGLPKFIIERPKKAIQYTTGVNHALRKLAKRENLTLRRYVEEVFLKAYKGAERENDRNCYNFHT